MPYAGWHDFSKAEQIYEKNTSSPTLFVFFRGRPFPMDTKKTDTGSAY